MLNILRSFIYKTKIFYILDCFDFLIFLNILKFLPIGFAEFLSKVRGYCRYALDLDWKSSCFGYYFMRDATRKAIITLTTSSESDVEKKVIARFIHQSREELEAKLFSLNNTAKWPKKVEYNNLEYLYAIQKQGHGIILLTAHFDSSIAGSIFIGNLGFNVNIFYDEIVFDSRVLRLFRNYFRSKYSAMQSHYNHGIFISRKNLKTIYNRLKRREVFVWLSDVLNVPGKIDVLFLNKQYKVSDNALRLAMKTNSYVGAYVTIWEGEGRYKTYLSKPVLPSALTDPEIVIRDCYSFLSHHILKSPERWWIADALQEFKE